MSDLYLDLRNKETRVLVANGATVAYSQVFTEQPDNAAELENFLGRLQRESGAGISKAHLILPVEEVMTGIHKTQAVVMADAEVIIGRSIAAETGDREPLFRLTRLAAEQELQVYLAESPPRANIERYVRMFRQAKVRLVTVTTSLQAMSAHLPALRHEATLGQVVFDIGPTAVEAIFFTPTEVLYHEFLPTSAALFEETEFEAESGQEKVSRRRLYDLMNAVHSLYSHYMGNNPQVPVEKVWLAGPESGIDGLTAALAEAMELEVALLAPEVSGLRDPAANAALAGLVQQVVGRQTVNFIPPELLRRFQVNARIVYFVFACLYCLALVAGVAITEKQISVAKRSLRNEQNTLEFLQGSAIRSKGQVKALNTIKDIIQSQVPFYGIFRELSLSLPDEVTLESLEFKQQQDGGRLVLTTATRHASEIGSSQVLTRLAGALAASEFLRQQGEPVITYNTRDGEEWLRIVITCELVLQREGNAR